MIKVLKMQLIALMLKNFLVVMLKLCSMLGLQHHTQNYADVIYLGPLLTTVHQRATLTWKIRDLEHNQILLLDSNQYCKTTNYY